VKYLKTYEKFDKESLKNSLKKTYSSIVHDKIQYLYEYLGGDTTTFSPPIKMRSLSKKGYVDFLLQKIEKSEYGVIQIKYRCKTEGTQEWENNDITYVEGTFDSFSISLEEAIQERYPDFEEWYQIQKEADKFNL
jgi:hypothetical protein